MNTIEIIDNEAAQIKERTINIYKEEVLKDIDLYTFKYADGTPFQDERMRDAATSDTTEKLDKAIIDRLLSFRDAKLRRLVQHSLVKGIKSSASNMPNAPSVLTYRLVLQKGFDDNTLQPLAEYIHQYLVYGVLADWYLQLGLPQAATYGSQVSTLEEDINSIVRGPSIVKRPLQPFGPAHKTIKW